MNANTHRTRPARSVGQTRGFTLVELLMAIVVVTILTVAAVPPMQDMIRSARLSTTADQLFADIQTARREAIARNSRVLICGVSSTGGASCGNTTSWNNGWLICYDDDADGTCDSSSGSNPNPIRTHGAVITGVTLTGPATAMRFNADGTQGGVGAATVTFTVTGDWSGTKTYTSTVAASGAVSSPKAS